VHGRVQPVHCLRVPVRGQDVGARPKDISQRHRERAASGTELQSSRAGALDTGPNERDMIAVIHRRMIALIHRRMIAG